MKKSYYNFIFKSEDGKNIAFNSMNCSLSEVDDDFFYILNNIDTIQYNKLNSNYKHVFNLMKENGYIIEDDEDELKKLKYRNVKARFEQAVLTIIIAPTLKCNFKCVYCYETSNCNVMTEKTQNDIISFANNHISNITYMNIVWYGGEPLLCKDIIYNLSKSLIDICCKNNINYNAYIISNGYLIDDETITNFKKYSITGAQITLDGPPDIHNKRRFLKSGKNDNFKKVFSAIKKLNEAKINVHIRINIDKTNIDYLDDLIDIFKENKMENFDIHFGQVSTLTESCKSISGTCYSTKEFSDVLIKLQEKLNKNKFSAGVDSIYYPSLKGNYCCADQINSFVIDPLGDIYKCMGSIGNKALAIGNISTFDIDENSNKFIDYMLSSPFDSQKCCECKLLPVCMGGCQSLKNSTYSTEFCERWKYNLKDILNYTYNCYKNYNDEFTKKFKVQ